MGRHAGHNVVTEDSLIRECVRVTLHTAVPRAVRLTDRQIEIIGLAALDLGDKEIADRLSISYQTVKNHLYEARRRLGVHTRTGLVICCLVDGIISLEPNTGGST